MAVAEKPANISFITGKTATVLNVFTYPPYRKKGIATCLLKMMIEDARIMELSYLDLSASEAGKPIYEKLGFVCNENSNYTRTNNQLLYEQERRISGLSFINDYKIAVMENMFFTVRLIN